MQTLGILLALLSFIGVIYLLVKAFTATQWHYNKLGERKALAEYGRIKRESPTSSDATLSEGEFVFNYVNSKGKPWKYVLFLVIIALVILPASCALMMAR